jgi:CMP-N-acetylneuraminic acid synthetase
VRRRWETFYAEIDGRINYTEKSGRETSPRRILMKIAIIPARGGSKRIPHKNIVEFCGKPMIAWTIEAAIDSGMFDKVCVSTDDKQIADVCRKYPVGILMRNGYSDDQTTVQQATIKSLQQLDIKEGTVVQLMACCPLRTGMDIKMAYLNYLQHKSKFQLSVTQYDFTNPWWALKLVKGKPKPLFPKEIKMRSQDLAKLYCPVGAIWIADIKSLFKANTFYAKGYDIYPIEFSHSIDIDTYTDMRIAEAFMRAKNERTL